VSAGGKAEGNPDLPNRFSLLLMLRRAIPPKTARKCQLGERFPRESGEKRETRNTA